MKIRTAFSQKENEIIIYENYKFSKLKRELSPGETKWRCTVKSCKAFLKTMTENKNITEKNVNHNHQIDLQKLRQVVSASAKRKATDDICERPAKILHRISTVQDTTLIKVSDVKYIKRNMYNARRNLLSPLPNTTQSVQEALNSM